MRHFVIVGILVIVVAVLTYLGLDAVGLLPVEASAQAVSIDWLWNWQVIAISFLFALIVVPMGYSLVVFRRRKGDTTDAEHIEGNTTLEIAWTVVPLIVVVIFAYMGAYSLGEVRRVDPNAITIKVKAQQFQWTYEYPEYGIVTNELHLPKDKQVVLKMEAVDVIHSFWVPEFRVKQDVVPGRVTEYRITPTLVGVFKVRCSELCGSGHATMEGLVVVSKQADYDKWIVAQQAIAAAAQTPEGRGQLLVTKNGCGGCHSITSTSLPNAPTWFALFGSNVELADGSTVVADEAYLTESIKDPKAKEVKGFAPSTMPPYALTDEEIANIVAYIKTLK
ncbi:MAG: cytochrome c oxidase subunit II [Anaerolineales bacterium]